MSEALSLKAVHQYGISPVLKTKGHKEFPVRLESAKSLCKLI